MIFPTRANSSLRRSALGFLLVIPLLLAGCASTGGSSSSGGDVIGKEEIDQWGTTFSNAYQIVEQLRPQWLRKRGRVSIGDASGMIDYIIVYEDQNRMGDPEALRAIPAQNVREIQRYSPGQAIPFGPPDHPHGAILVRTKTGL